MKQNIKIWLAFATLIGVIAITACRKSIDINPPIDKIDEESAFSTDENAASVLTGIYIKMVDITYLLTLYTALSADELSVHSFPDATVERIFLNSLGVNDGLLWSALYNDVYRSNSAIEGINNSHSLSQKVKAQLLGEAKFIRAFCYFYLVNLYGDVPLLTVTDYTVNQTLAKSDKDTVYNQIVMDLEDALSLLNEEYLSADAKTLTSERFRPNKYVAEALLARVYLYRKMWDKAEALSSDIINQKSRYQLSSDLNEVFLTSSKEVIWQLQPVEPNYNTLEARKFILFTYDDINNKHYYLNKSITKNVLSEDKRRGSWTKCVYNLDDNGTVLDSLQFSYKYKVFEFGEPLTEAVVMFRLAEQYLIRAEARAQQGKLSGENGSESDLNTIRYRSGLPKVRDIEYEKILNAVYNERQIELFLEFGHRWLDLKRTGNIDSVMSQACHSKGGEWQSYQQLYPIPQMDINKNGNLTQNAGY